MKRKKKVACGIISENRTISNSEAIMNKWRSIWKWWYSLFEKWLINIFSLPMRQNRHLRMMRMYIERLRNNHFLRWKRLLYLQYLSDGPENACACDIKWMIHKTTAFSENKGAIKTSRWMRHRNNWPWREGISRHMLMVSKQAWVMRSYVIDGTKANQWEWRQKFGRAYSEGIKIWREKPNMSNATWNTHSFNNPEQWK